jgi:putative nucleotidyltransferase with HDIG domain
MVVSNLQEEEGHFNFSELLANEEFVTQIATPLITKGHVKGVLEIFQRKQLDTDSEWLEFLEAVADLGAIAIDNATMFDTIQRSNVDLSLAYESTIEGWSRAMDMRDKNTEGHSYRVMEMTLQIARKLEIKDEDLVHIRRGALLHDMGKMGVPDSILLKSGPLTDEEWTIMRRHPENAWKMLSPIEHLRPAIDIPYFHHEKWDGTGYPKGLKGEEIPLAARIFAIVDVWDALTSNRPYRVAWPEERVLQHIRSLSGKHFDPRIVEIFEMMQDEFKNKFDPEGIRLSPAI